MKERPILFSRPMVRAILDGRKTQTRRIVKHPAIFRNGAFEFICNGQPLALLPEDFVLHASRHGQPGDQLWVKETFARADDEFIYRECPMFDSMILSGEQFGFDWTPSIFMPRTASRITLEIVGVRVDRLNAITEDDAKAEGVEEFIDTREPSFMNCKGILSDHYYSTQFSDLWESINGEGSWDKNPWVWVIEFKRIKP
jgi:hypothetical protein